MQKCAIIGYRWNWRSKKIQSDYKCISGLQNPEGKNCTLGIASAWWNRTRHQWQRDHQGYCVCVVKPSTTPMTSWPPRPRAPSTQRTWTSTREWCTRDPMCAYSSSQVLVVMIAHTSWLKFHLCASSHGHHMMSVSLRLWLLHSLLLPHLLIHLQSLALPPALLPQPWGQWNTAYFAWKERSRRLLPPHRSPSPTTSWTYVEVLTVPAPQFSEQGLEDVMRCTALEDMLHNAHRVHVYDSQREGLSVGQSSSSVSERTERSVGERTGRLVRPSGQELNVGNASVGQTERANSRRMSGGKLRNTTSKLIVTQEVYENWVKLLNLSKKNFIALKQKNVNDEINNFFMDSYYSKIRNYVKLIIKVSMKELKKFQSSTFDTITRRRLVDD